MSEKDSKQHDGQAKESLWKKFKKVIGLDKSEQPIDEALNIPSDPTPKYNAPLTHASSNKKPPHIKNKNKVDQIAKKVTDARQQEKAFKDKMQNIKEMREKAAQKTKAAREKAVAKQKIATEALNNTNQKRQKAAQKQQNKADPNEILRNYSTENIVAKTELTEERRKAALSPMIPQSTPTTKKKGKSQQNQSRS